MAGNSVVCLAGARSLLRLEKKDTVVCLAGVRSLLRPEKNKIQSSIWWVRDHRYDRKKKIQLSVWRVRDHYYDRKRKKNSLLSGGCGIMSVFHVAIVIFVLVQLELNLIQIR